MVSNFQNFRIGRAILLPGQSPKVLLQCLESIFSLQAHNIWQTLLAVFQSLSSVSCRISGDSFTKQHLSLKDYDTFFRQFSSHFSLSLACPLYTARHLVQARSVSCPNSQCCQLKANFIMSYLNDHQSLRSNWYCQKQTCLTVKKSLSS